MPDDPIEQPTTPARPPDPAGIAATPGMPPPPTSPPPHPPATSPLSHPPATGPLPPGGQSPPTSIGMPIGPTDPWPHTGPTELAGPVPAAAGGWRRRFWPLVTAGAAVLGVTSFLVVFLWPGGSLEFQPLEPVRTIAVADDETDPRLIDLDGDRVVIAAERGGEIVVFGTAVSGDGDAWTRPVPNLRSAFTMVLHDDVVAVFGDNGSDADEAQPYLAVVLDAGDGAPLWQRQYGYDASWLHFDRHLTLVDDDGTGLAGVGLRSGEELWRVPFPEGGAAVHPVITEADLTGKSSATGQYDLPRAGDRVVVVGADGSAQVVDAGSGEPVGGAGANVAGVGDYTYAYEDEFFVLSGDEGRLYRFDLDNLSAQPRIVYSLTDPDAQVNYLVPCGTDRICLREETSESSAVLWVDTVEGGLAGRVPITETSADELLPVGDRLVVSTEDNTTVVFERDGAGELGRFPGAPVRVDGANILIAAADGFGYESMALTGFPVGDDEPRRTELGQAPDVWAAGCAWDDQLLVCPTSGGAGIWQFATAG